MFVIPGEPCGKARPRVVRNGSFTRAYTPEKTVAYENLVKLEYQRQCNGCWFDGPVNVSIIAFFGIPASVSKKKAKGMQAGSVLPTKKPDCDNIGKIICDALNGVAYKDDAQVVRLTIAKRYETIPNVYVYITEA